DELRARYEQVMVDEFQDVNPLQGEIVDLLSEDNLFVVGDENQSIYGFRHAEVELFRQRRAIADAEGRAAVLLSNFRSRPEVLGAVNRVFGEVWAEPGYDPLRPNPEAELDPPPPDPP